MKKISCLLALALLLPATALANRLPVSIGEGSSLPLCVLTRPMATLYADKEGTTAVQSNLPAFQSYFVYDRPSGEALGTGTGFYEVGTDDKGKVVGWLNGADLFEWRQTMCLTYTHPEGRHPVLMFEEEDKLAALAAALLGEMLKAGRSNQVSGEDFFTSLQAASAVASRDPDLLSKSSSLAKSGLIPDFLDGLPYHSQLMDMNNDLWASWGPDEQDVFLNRMEAKIKAYASIHDTPDIWVTLNAGDDSSDMVAPVLLELMP